MQVTIVEASDKLLSKVRISGGGRCNVTHNHSSIAAMTKCYPRGVQHVKKLFKQFFVTDTLTWFAERGVPIVAEQDGRMFPKANTSEAIIDCLMQDAKKHKVNIALKTKVTQIQKTTAGFDIFTTQSKLRSDFVVLTCGGFPKIDSFNFITALGHTVAAPVPSLFTFNISAHPAKQLMGLVAPNATVKISGFTEQYTGPVLITHWGLSGPAVLKLSAYAARFLQQQNYAYNISINWCGDYNENTMLQHVRQYRDANGKQLVVNSKLVDLPSRLWQFLVQQAEISDSTKWSDLPAKEQNNLVKILCATNFKCAGKTTFKDEFVTAGGINLSEINSSTCESTIVQNLFFAGEVLDCDGITGGFNFQHAWSSAFVAAQAISEMA
jgi:predicted Rossmann fold flavoprotein